MAPSHLATSVGMQRVGEAGRAAQSKRLRFRALGGLVLLLASARISAQTTSIEASADTYLKSGSPNQSSGSDSFLRIQSSGHNRSLVRFGQDAIAAAVGLGSLVSAHLELYIEGNSNNWGSAGQRVDLLRAQEDWSETGATWNCGIDTSPTNSQPDCVQPWGGGSFDAEPTDTILHTNGLAGWVSFDVTGDVESFLAGSPNYGWIIKKNDEGQSGQVEYTSRQGASGQRPRLVLVVESESNDSVPPELLITSPVLHYVVNDPAPQIALQYHDGGSGVDIGSLEVELDGASILTGCAVAESSAVCVPAALAAGSHTIHVHLRDGAGNRAEADATFTLLMGPGSHMATLEVTGDSYLLQGAPNQNAGGASFLDVRQSGHHRALAMVDPDLLESTLAETTLRSAMLELFVETNGKNWGATGRTVEAHRLTAPWAESAVTWNCSSDTNLANSQADCDPQWLGGSFEPTPTASVLHTSSSTGWAQYDVTADVEAFLSGAESFGWLIKKSDEGASGKVTYASREGVAGHGPRLVFVFDTPSSQDETPPTISIASPADGALVASQHITVVGSASDDVELASLEVDGQEVPVDNGEFSTTIDLAEGATAIVVEATDAAGNPAFATVTVTLDTTPPTLSVNSPRPGELTNQATVQVTGSVEDLNGVSSLTVNGTPAFLAHGGFEVTVPLVEGDNGIAVIAIDAVGNESQASIPVRRFSLPAVEITTPADLTTLAATTVDVRGTVTDLGTAVAVDGVEAVVSGTSFEATGVPLVEGGNTITAMATDTSGHVGTATISLVRDLTPPHVVIYAPTDGSVVHQPEVVVSGLINDIVSGTVNQEQASVTVNGRQATVANRSFLVPSVPLVSGPNVINAVARDASGNEDQTQVTVTYQPATGPHLRIVSGDQQEAVIGTLLAEPLIVEALDGAGLPISGQPVVLKVSGNDGTLDGGQREVLVPTDVSGRASSHFTLGRHAGAGNQTVFVSAVGCGAPLVFHHSAIPGAPALTVVDSGDQQVGMAGQRLPRPLIAAVVDEGANRLEGTPVTFTVVEGRGHFDDGAQSLTLPTDSDGRAIVTFTTGPDDGISNNVVTARVEAMPEGQAAVFTSSGWSAGEPSQTSITGIVVDNSNQPVPGVTMRIRDTSTTTQADAAGFFRIAPAPVGRVTLIVDGSTTTRSGSWPDLEFELTTIPGRENTLGRPAYLLPLNEAEGMFVDENHGGTLTLGEMPGFSLEIAPGSVTFPGGSRSGVVSATVVHADKVPMVPSFGQQPRLILTIQPPGSRFDPPARMTLPNVEGLASGQVTEMYSFDHDLGHFVSIGPATVSDDGALIIANPGVGLTKGGWHCGGDPAHTGTPADCGCKTCNGVQCVIDPARDHRNCENTPGKVCFGGNCTCAVPTNYHQVSSSHDGAGVLHFKYEWDSSTHSLQDLSNCSVGEKITFDTPNAIFVWPPPWEYSNLNGDTIEGNANFGVLTDRHGNGPIRRPYVEASFTATQIYYYKCPCDNNGQPVTMMGPLSITRTIHEVSPGIWQYTITKTGETGTVTLPPQAN